ncbi:MAG: hypothetical protein ACFFB3_18335 [Candidatus Hodarchaeota archaeon]
MLEIRLFGRFRKLSDNPDPSANSILRLQEKDGENLEQLVHRIGINPEELGELFINGNVANLESIVPVNARVGIFPLGMHLLCGGQHLKGHGYITKRSKQPEQPRYWQKREK